MCGIAGLFPGPGAAAPADAEAIVRVLAHRGPDDHGVLRAPWGGGEALLVHRRLSILGLGGQGHQPMTSSDGRFHLVFNGEIYNFVELRRELAGLGHAFRTETDTEVLLAAHAQWGAGAPARLVGMFAYAVLDTLRGTLFLARDPFGIKPLFHTPWRGGVAFASEIKTLLRLDGVPRRVNSQRAYEYLRYSLTDHGDETLIEGIRQLPAAHWMELRPDAPAPEPVRYWSVEPPERSRLSVRDAAEELRAIFLDNVRLHLRSDVPVGAALSGGVDSSAIVCAMRRVDPSVEIHAFSYVADDAALSEERWADLVGAAAGARVHKVRTGPEELVRDLDALIVQQDEPFGSTSIYAQFRVFRLAAEHGIKVMLDGQGADELLAGYQPFLAARAATLARSGRWVELARFSRRAMRLPGVQASWFARYLASALVPDAPQEALRRATGQGDAPEWIRAEWVREHRVRPLRMDFGGGPERMRNLLLRSTTQTSLPMLLRYEDRNSMAWSVESRVPFLTASLAHFVLSLPEGHIVDRNATTKAVFRAAMRGIVPDAVLDRRDKIGFATPERRWASALDPLVRATLRGDAARRAPMFSLPALEREWDGVLAGRVAYDFRIWRWVNFLRWAELLEIDLGAA